MLRKKQAYNYKINNDKDTENQQYDSLGEDSNDEGLLAVHLVEQDAQPYVITLALR